LSPAIYCAFFFTVALLVTTAYFLMGGLPLLILKHDVPLDSRFIRSFFNLYYRLAMAFSLLACLSYIGWAKWPFAWGAGVIVGVSWLLRKFFLRKMDGLGARIHANDADAILEFRRVHALALLINLAQLVVIVGSMVKLTKQLF
jgi:hypothetical protein